jgi:hypothetical protein
MRPGPSTISWIDDVCCVFQSQSVQTTQLTEFHLQRKILHAERCSGSLYYRTRSTMFEWKSVPEGYRVQLESYDDYAFLRCKKSQWVRS